MDKVLEEVKNKHELVLSRGENVIFTALVGSQNYGLATENSDVDTYSFILPSYDDFLLNKEPKSYEIELKDGSKACVKDIRLLFKLIKKASPNSLECILSKYMIINPHYEETLKYYLDNDMLLYPIVHCNSNHLFDAIAGTIKGLHGRNISVGKKYSHIIRLIDFLNKYIDTNEDPHNYLMVYEDNIDRALDAKNGQAYWLSEEVYQQIAEANIKLVNTVKTSYKPAWNDELFGQALVDNMQCSVMNHFLKLNGWTRTIPLIPCSGYADGVENETKSNI